MAMAVSRTSPRRSTWSLPVLAVGALLCLRAALPSASAFVSNSAAGTQAQQRRAVVAGLVAAPFAAQQSGAYAEEAAAPKEEKSSKVSKSWKGGAYSFDLPSPAGDWAMATRGDGQASYKRKDGAFIFVTPVSKGMVKAKANKVGFPGQGAMFTNYKLGKDVDEFEYTKLSTAFRGARGGGAFPGGFFVNDGDPTTFHEWNRCLHGPNGDVMMTVAVGMDGYEASKAQLTQVLDSFKLA